MRSLFLSFLLLASVIAGHAADVEFLRVWPAWRGVESFDRISEYFGGRENSKKTVVLRTQAEDRAGYYFLVRVKNTTALEGVTFELTVIRPDTPLPIVHRFSAAVPQKESVFQLGLTGRDWPGGEKTHPVAWKLALIGSDQQVLTEEKSFLWEKPAK